MIRDAVDLLERAHKPVVIAGSGVLWSEAWSELQAFVEASGVPFYTTPMATGLIAEDHPLSFPAARSTAFRDADCFVVIGTRDNYVIGFLQPPVMNGDASLIELNIRAGDISRNRLADVGMVATQRLASPSSPKRSAAGNTNLERRNGSTRFAKRTIRPQNAPDHKQHPMKCRSTLRAS